MRTTPFVAFMVLSALCHAQDWALLNPAYRYNFSHDGSDTISNQVFVTHIDTLGVDSFRFGLNRIAEPCIGCAPGCQLRWHLPQFMMGECVVSNDTWSLSDTLEYAIHARANVGATWVFDATNSITGTLTALTEETVLGVVDSVRTMTTILNDTIQWSKNHGLVRWHLHSGMPYTLLGVHGPDAGELIPSPKEFFPYQPGDILQRVDWSGDSWQTHNYYRQVHIQTRYDQGDTLVFYCTADLRLEIDGSFVSSYHGAYTMHIDSLNILGYRILKSFPDQLVNMGTNGTWSGGEQNLWSTHHRLMGGPYEIRADSTHGFPLFAGVDSMPHDCAPRISTGPFESILKFDTRGLYVASFGEWNNYFGSAITAAIIGGDTLGIWRNDAFYHVGIEEEQKEAWVVHPNPVQDRLYLPVIMRGLVASVFDTQGRYCLTEIIGASTEFLDVHSLQAGIYILRVDGYEPQQFVIAR